MRSVKKRGFIWGLMLWLGFSLASAQEVKDSVKIHFHTGKHYLDMDLGENRVSLESIKNKLQMMIGDSVYYRLRKVLVVGGASPEGSIALNKRLSERRAATLFDYLSQYDTFPDSVKHTLFIGRDWQGLKHLVKLDDKVPYQEEVLELLDKIAANAEATGKDDGVWRLRSLRGGKPYKYMYHNLFPALRASSMYLWYAAIELPPFSFHTSLKKDPYPMGLLEERPLYVYEPVKPEKTFTMALKTNLLYDALLVPNIGAEFYLGKNWSVGGNWMYAWWKHDTRHWYWRIYGGDIYLRKWFGKVANENPLTGHHVGVYAQMFTYDFETGGRGYMGGKPGGSLWEQADYAFGVEYGYSYPIAPRLNLDFTLGLGYWGGKYYEYLPEDDCYVWQTTKNRRWFGPTKAEIALVWILGKGNCNKEKGGRR